MLLWCTHTSLLIHPSYLGELISYYFPHSLYSNITWRHLNFFVYFQHILHFSVSFQKRGSCFSLSGVIFWMFLKFTYSSLYQLCTLNSIAQIYWYLFVISFWIIKYFKWMTRSSATQQPSQIPIIPSIFLVKFSIKLNGAVILPWVQVPNVPVIADVP